MSAEEHVHLMTSHSRQLIILHIKTSSKSYFDVSHEELSFRTSVVLIQSLWILIVWVLYFEQFRAVLAAEQRRAAPVQQRAPRSTKRPGPTGGAAPGLCSCLPQFQCYEMGSLRTAEQILWSSVKLTARKNILGFSRGQIFYHQCNGFFKLGVYKLYGVKYNLQLNEYTTVCFRCFTQSHKNR